MNNAKVLIEEKPRTNYLRKNGILCQPLPVSYTKLTDAIRTLGDWLSKKELRTSQILNSDLTALARGTQETIL